MDTPDVILDAACKESIALMRSTTPMRHGVRLAETALTTAIKAAAMVSVQTEGSDQ